MVPDLSITNLRDDLDVRRTVRRTIEAAIDDTIQGTQRRNGGPIPAIGTAEWFEADHLTRVASILLLGERYLTDDPEREIRQRLRCLVWDVSDAIGGRWGSVVDHEELERRRAQPGPLAREVDQAAAARWAQTGSTDEEGTAA